MADGSLSAGHRTHRIVDVLNREWALVLARQGDVVGAWSRSEPALTGCADLEGTVGAASAGEDDVLHALLQLSGGGDTLAARTVLQAMLGRLVRMAGRDGIASVDDYVAALWCVVARYPLRARPARIAANLALDTLKAVHAESRGWERSPQLARLPMEELEGVVQRFERRATLNHQASAELQASQVIDAARTLRLIDDRVHRLLCDVYVEGLSGAEVASRHASTPGSVRVRCSRAVQRLAQQADRLAAAA